MLRGDDVAELQQRLCTLGFDTGRVDGIFGDATGRALAEFQRNAGLPVDGIVGGATLRELMRLESRHHDPELVSSVRARAALRDAPPTLRGRHVAVGESGGLGSVTGALRRRLTWAASGSPSCTTPTTPCRPRRPTSSGSTSSSASGSIPRPRGAAPPSGRAGTTSPPAGGGWPSWSRPTSPEALGITDAGVHGMSVPSSARPACRPSS